MSILVPAQAYQVVVYPVGAIASASVTGSAVVSVRQGYGIVRDDKVWNLTTNKYVGVVQTAAAAQITFTANVANAVSSGDVLLGMGLDSTASNSSAPTWDGSRAQLYTNPDYTQQITSSIVTSNAHGEYSYYHRGDGRVWEVIIDTNAVLRDFITGTGGLPRYNVCDFGWQVDEGTSTTREANARIINLLLKTLPTEGGDIYIPAGDWYLSAGIDIDRGEVSITGEDRTRLMFSLSDDTFQMIKVNKNNAASEQVKNVTIRSLTFWDADPTAHPNSGPPVDGEESHGIVTQYVDSLLVENCYFHQMGDEAIQIGKQSYHAKVTNCHFYRCANISTGGAGVSLSNCKRAIVTGNSFDENYNAGCIRIEGNTASEDSQDHVISNNVFDSPIDNLAAGSPGGSGIIFTGSKAQTIRNIVINSNTFRNCLRMAVHINPTADLAVANLVITNNAVYGGGSGTFTASRGAFNLAGGASTNTVSNGVIANNMIADWGSGEDLGTKNGIRINLDGFIIQGNRIENIPAGAILIEGSGARGNLIFGNYISACGGTANGSDASVPLGIGIAAKGKDLVIANYITGINSPDASGAITPTGIGIGDGPADAQVLAALNYVNAVTEDTSGIGGRGIRLYKNSIGYMNIVEACDRGIVLNDGTGATSPSSVDNVLIDNTTEVDNDAVTGFARIQHAIEFGDGTVGHHTDASGTTTLVSGQTTIDVTHGVQELNAEDVHVTPIESWGTATKWWVHTVGAATFTIEIDQVAGADVDFAWHIIKRSES